MTWDRSPVSCRCNNIVQTVANSVVNKWINLPEIRWTIQLCFLQRLYHIPCKLIDRQLPGNQYHESHSLGTSFFDVNSIPKFRFPARVASTGDVPMKWTRKEKQNVNLHAELSYRFMKWSLLLPPVQGSRHFESQELWVHIILLCILILKYFSWWICRHTHISQNCFVSFCVDAQSVFRFFYFSTSLLFLLHKSNDFLPSFHKVIGHSSSSLTKVL